MPAADDRPPPRAFVSYTRDSERHERQVLDFARFLRSEAGVDVRLDLWAMDERRDWSVWVMDQLAHADFVLVIASPAYKRRAEGAASVDGGGTQFETALLRDLLVGDRDRWVRGLLPVVLPGRSADEVPVFLQPHSARVFRVDSFSLDGVDELLRVLSGQPRHPMPELGPPIVRTPLAGSPWQRDQEVVVDREHLVIVATEVEEVAPDRSWVRRQAVARRLSPPTHLVLLRQVTILRHNGDAERQRRAIIAEATLLADTANTAGIPQLLGQVVDHSGVTLVVSQPIAHSLRDLYGSPPDSAGQASPLEPTRTIGFLETLLHLCRPLQALHERGISHRQLTPDTILMVSSSSAPVLRDIGLATTPPARGEGISPYRAPEQRHPGRYATTPGPRTDIFQLALIIIDTITGKGRADDVLADVHDPSMPVHLTGLLTCALSPAAARRPQDAVAFAGGLASAIDRLRLGQG